MTTETALLTEIQRRIAKLSSVQHEMARQQSILTRSATQLRLGRSAAVVMAEIQEQCPDLLTDWCDVNLTRKAS